MNTDLLISVLVQSNWLFLAGWIVLLGAAFALSFPEKPLLQRRAKSSTPARL
jgi:uncharacterized protein involved in exopolysaccharide biosynthesis